MTKLEKYLIPSSINKNCSPLGIVIPFVRNTSPRISILLFYDYRTGRVERHLINAEKELYNNKQKYDTDVFMFKGKKYLIDNSEDYLINDKWNNLKFDNSLLNDGRLSKGFYKLFMHELIRDYLFTTIQFHESISYKFTNMNTIRRWTHPINKWLDTADLPLGSGDLSAKEKTIIHNDTYHSLKKIAGERSNFLIKTDFSKPLLLNVPTQFVNVFDSFENISDILKFESLKSKDYTLGISDLKSTIKFKGCNNIDTIEKRIRTFNNNILLRLNKMNNTPYPIIRNSTYFLFNDT